jgi:hypothetical protein
MRDTPARDAAAHLDALQTERPDVANELLLFRRSNEIGVIEKSRRDERREKRVLTRSHAIY